MLTASPQSARRGEHSIFRTANRPHQKSQRLRWNLDLLPAVQSDRRDVQLHSDTLRGQDRRKYW